MEKGTYESTKWIDGVVYKTNLPRVSQKIYDFWMYRKVVNTCSDQYVYEMCQLVEKHGMTIGVKMTINHIRGWRADQAAKKRRYTDNLLNAPTVSVESFKDQIEEEDRLTRLTDEQKRLRDAMWPGKDKVPRSVLTAQPVIYSYEDEDGVGYKIFEKIYWYYSAIVYSPMMKEGEEVLLMHHNWKDQWGLQYKVDNAYKAAKEEYRKYRIHCNYDSKSKNGRNSNGGYTPNIDKVRKNLGLDGNDDNNLNGDIF